MAFNVGFDFRLTSGFVTDPTNYTYVLASDTSSSNSRTPVGQSSPVSFYWQNVGGTNPSARDRSAAEIAQCAGMNFINNFAGTGLFDDFTLTLPTAGSYSVALAMGDPTTGGAQNQYFSLFDGSNTTALASATNVSTAVDHFMDIKGTVWNTGATWLANNVAGTYTFTTTTLRLRIGSGITSGSNSSTIACLIVQLLAASSNAGPTVLMHRRNQLFYIPT